MLALEGIKRFESHTGETDKLFSWRFKRVRHKETLNRFKAINLHLFVTSKKGEINLVFTATPMEKLRVAGDSHSRLTLLLFASTQKLWERECFSTNSKELDFKFQTLTSVFHVSCAASS